MKNCINPSRGWPSSSVWTFHDGLHVSHDIKQYNIQQISIFVQTPGIADQRKAPKCNVQCNYMSQNIPTSQKSAVLSSCEVCNVVVMYSIYKNVIETSGTMKILWKSCNCWKWTLCRNLCVSWPAIRDTIYCTYHGSISNDRYGFPSWGKFWDLHNFDLSLIVLDMQITY